MKKQFKEGESKMFCKNCGTKMGNEKICPNCGYNEKKDISINSNFNESKLFINAEEAKKLELTKVAVNALVVILGLVLLFLPIFQSPLNDLQDFLNMDLEDFESMLKNDGLIRFSYYEEAKLVFNQVFDKNSSVNLYELFLSPLFGLWLLIVCFIYWIISGSVAIIKSLLALQDIDRLRISYFMRFEKYQKDPILQLRGNFDIVIFFIATVFDGFLAYGTKSIHRKMIARGVFNFSNFSPFFILAVLIVIAFFGLKFWYNNYDEELKKNIAKRRKQRKEQNKKENEEAHKRNLERKKEQQGINSAK